MNIYIVVEGEIGEKQVYREWIPYVNNKLCFSPTIEQVNKDNFFIVHGGGFPQYFSIIKKAIKDILTITTIDKTRLFSRLVVSADSEENTYSEKKKELISFIEEQLLLYRVKDIDYKIIIQNFCLEAWALGNRRIITRATKSEELKKYIKHHNVVKKDPELLTPFYNEVLTRAQHAEKYLRITLLNKHKNLTYTKSNPVALLSKKYFEQLKNRLDDTMHIQSFNDFLEAFK